MNCDCISDITKQLKAHAAGSMGCENPKVSMEGLGINLSTGETTIALAFIVRGDNRKFKTAKGQPISMIASYCPFCGVSTKKEKAAKATQ